MEKKKEEKKDKQNKNKNEKLEWETPQVTKINITSTGGEFNFLADANQLT